MKRFNELSPAETERLALLMEECAEVAQIIGKILRHGYESTHPDGGPTNRDLLEQELGHVYSSVERMTRDGDLLAESIFDSSAKKAISVQPYLHHQGNTP